MKATTSLLILLAATPAFAQSALSPAEPTTVPTTAPATRPASVVTLKTGERVAGAIVEQDAERVIVESRTLGRLTIATGDVESIAAPLDALAAAAPTTKPVADEGAGGVASDFTSVSPLSVAPPPPPGDRGLFGTGFLKEWARQLEVGFSGSSGNNESLSGNAQFNASISNDVYRSTLGVGYFLDESNGTIGRNNGRAFGTVDRRLDGGPYFVFGRTQYDYDDLQNWRNRYSIYGGPGYEFYKRPTFELLGRVGVGYTIEWDGTYADDYDKGRLEALVGIDGKWKINDTSGLVFSSYYTPSIEDFMAEGRVVTTVAYQADFATYRGLGFKTGFEHTYEFRTAGDDEHNNWKYFANLVFKL